MSAGQVFHFCTLYQCSLSLWSLGEEAGQLTPWPFGFRMFIAITCAKAIPAVILSLFKLRAKHSIDAHSTTELTTS
jgi:hypothetical protein